MEQKTVTTEKTNDTNRPSTSALAVVGFVVLIIIGIILAILAARYVPVAISNMTGGNSTTTDNSLAAVPTTTLSFDDTASSTEATTTDTTTMVADTDDNSGWTSTPFNGGSSQTAAVGQSQTQYQTYASQNYFPGSTPVQVPVENYGLSNLTVKITDVGYLDKNGKFVSDHSLRSDDELIVKILVTNNGTNSTGNWQIRTVVPTQADKTFTRTADEPSLAPGATLPLILDLTHGKLEVGNNEQIKVTVDSSHDINESNENDNSDTKDIDVRK